MNTKSARKITGGAAMSTSAPETATTTPQSTWSYVVRPPQWPIVSTPRQRGGVRAQTTAIQAHFVLCTEATVERIFFLHAVDASGANVACDCDVEAVPRPGSTPPELTIAGGWFVERRLGGSGAGWGSLQAIAVSSLALTDPVRVRLDQVIAAGPGGVGGGVSG